MTSSEKLRGLQQKLLEIQQAVDGALYDVRCLLQDDPTYDSEPSFSDDSEDVVPRSVLHFVHAKWCPHCVAFKPVWEQEIVPAVRAAGLPVDLQVTDSEDRAFIAKHNVRGFPSLLLERNGASPAIPFEGTRSVENVLNFLRRHAR